MLPVSLLQAIVSARMAGNRVVFISSNTESAAGFCNDVYLLYWDYIVDCKSTFLKFKSGGSISFQCMDSNIHGYSAVFSITDNM